MVSSTPNNDTGEDWDAQLADYAMGVMLPADAAEFERRLAECRSRILSADAYVQVVGALGMAGRPVEPPEGHKERFLSRVAATPQESSAAVRTSVSQGAPQGAMPQTAGAIVDLAAYRERKWSTTAWPVATALVAVLLVAVGLWAILSLQQQNSRLNIPPGYTPFTIQGQGPDPKALAVGFLNRQTNQVTIVAQNLPQLSTSEVYELWWIPPGYPSTPPVAAGTFQADNSGEARHSAQAATPVGDYVAVAVTREPAPGGPSPRGPVVLLGSFATP